VAGHIPRCYARPKTVTRPSANRPIDSAAAAGIELTSIESQVRRHNHETTEPPREWCVLQLLSLLENTNKKPHPGSRTRIHQSAWLYDYIREMAKMSSRPNTHFVDNSKTNRHRAMVTTMNMNRKSRAAYHLPWSSHHLINE